MESRIEELLEKYWNGETSLTEEEELKAYYAKNPSLTPTGLFFRSLNKSAEVKSDVPFDIPKKRWISSRYSVAATILIGVALGAAILQNEKSRNDFEIEDPQKAYEIAREALMKMSTSLNEGQTHSGQLKKINKAEEVLKKEKL